MAGIFDDIPAINFDGPEDQVRAEIAKLPEKQRKPALDVWADHFVAKEREQGGVGQAINNGVRALARGTPVGSWLDEANAVTGAGLNAVSGGYLGAPYEEGAAYQRAADRAYDKENPVTSTALQVTGALASAPLAPAAQVVRGGSMGARVANGLATGVGYGAAYGLGEGEGLNRLENGAIGAGTGGAIGAVAAPAARAVGNAAEYVMNAVKGAPQAVQGFERGAVNRVSRAMVDDGITSADEYAARIRPLGREGMILDAGQNLQNQAGAIANQPGAGQGTLVSRLDARKAGAPDRIEQSTNVALGQPANMRQTIDDLVAQRSADAGPLYEKALEHGPVWNNRLQQFLDDPITKQGLKEGIQIQRLEALAKGEKFNPTDYAVVDFNDAMEPILDKVPNMRTLNVIKKGFDNILEGYRDKVTGRLVLDEKGRAIEGVRKAFVSELDKANPDYKAARAAWEGPSRVKDAYHKGQDIFDKGTRRDDLARAWEGATPTERDALRIGARDQIREVVDNSGTAFGPNGDTAARRMLGSASSRDKLDLVAQPGGSDLLLGRLDAESTFERGRQGVLGNSATSRRLQAQKEFPNSTEPVLKSNGGSSLYGRVEQGLMKVANALTGGGLNERNARIAADAADMLSRQGGGRDAVAKALIAYGENRQMSRQGRDAIERVARQLMAGGRGAAIAAGTD